MRDYRETETVWMREEDYILKYNTSYRKKKKKAHRLTGWKLEFWGKYKKNIFFVLR